MATLASGSESKSSFRLFYCHDYARSLEEINDRGIALDRDLVAQAVRLDEQSRRELSAEMRKITRMENPNSVSQMKQWLADHGLEVDSLDKKAVR